MNKILFCILLAFVTFINSAFAWSPPSIIKVVVGQSPGGGNEFAFRGINTLLENNNPGVNFIIEHHPGLDNVVAMNYFADQKPDGRTMMVVVQATGFVAAPVAYKSKLRVDPMSYTFVSALAQSPMALIVPSGSEIKTVPQLIARLKDTRAQYNIGISGSINLLTYSYLVDRLAVDTARVKSINFNSPTEASVAVAGGHIDMAIVPLSVPKPLIDGGKVRLLAHTGSTAITGVSAALMKDHVPGLAIDATWSAFLPPNTPADIVEWYRMALTKALSAPEAQRYYESSWATINKSAQGPDGLARSINALRTTWLPVANKVMSESR